MRKLEFARLLCRFDLSLFCPESYIPTLNNFCEIFYLHLTAVMLSKKNSKRGKSQNWEIFKIEFLIVILFFNLLKCLTFINNICLKEFFVEIQWKLFSCCVTAPGISFFYHKSWCIMPVYQFLYHFEGSRKCDHP